MKKRTLMDKEMEILDTPTTFTLTCPSSQVVALAHVVFIVVGA